MVSGTHPDAPHISGVRAGRFAAELARMGHRCVLLCPPLPGNEAREPAAMHGYNWSTPYLIEVDDPEPTAHRVMTLLNMLLHGGRRTGFHDNLLACGRELAASFTAQVGWATFGSLEAVFALRTLAEEQGVPWIFDDKDNPEIYVPRLLRRPIAWQLKGYAALQTNSVLHGEAAERWLGCRAEVVYSGVDDCFFPVAPSIDPEKRYITLVGSLYFREIVDEIVAGIADYNRTSGRLPLGIVCLGTQGEWLANDLGVAVEAPGYVSAPEMARICQAAVANAYVFFHRGFHHKLFELLACRRPVIAYGGELPESIAEAERLHAPLATPVDGAGLTAALTAAENYAPDPAMPDRFFTWPEQAGMVAARMRRLIA